MACEKKELFVDNNCIPGQIPHLVSGKIHWFNFKSGKRKF